MFRTYVALLGAVGALVLGVPPAWAQEHGKPAAKASPAKAVSAKPAGGKAPATRPKAAPLASEPSAAEHEAKPTTRTSARQPARPTRARVTTTKGGDTNSKAGTKTVPGAATRRPAPAKPDDEKESVEHAAVEETPAPSRTARTAPKPGLSARPTRTSPRKPAAPEHEAAAADHDEPKPGPGARPASRAQAASAPGSKAAPREGAVQLTNVRATINDAVRAVNPKSAEERAPRASTITITPPAARALVRAPRVPAPAPAPAAPVTPRVPVRWPTRWHEVQWSRPVTWMSLAWPEPEPEAPPEPPAEGTDGFEQ